MICPISLLQGLELPGQLVLLSHGSLQPGALLTEVVSQSLDFVSLLRRLLLQLLLLLLQMLLLQLLLLKLLRLVFNLHLLHRAQNF